LLRGSQDAAERLAVKSALNPLLWLCGITVPMLLGAAWWFDHSGTLRGLCSLLVYVALSPVVLSTLVGTYLAFFKPDKLQSEDYQIRQQALLTIQQMGPASHIKELSSIVEIVKSASLQ